ncbi:hypothetical protein OKJ48_28950 [Streptomyces kunmingensis]|uniref:Uncharacterized protein n=1 Tax=Streptomyces kunmingensis TaxID=68225 RepID=A0ABU6CHP3_9ACTN|nr:hypothetical protein [Streptomyces kunmingensis]MEB3964240.1 hypothetical protein [Streptomyces kunmingensis]
MTQQRGHGEDPHLPAARQAHEGIVLPADGGEPLLPGTFGDQAGPTGASPWGQPWGPESQQAQAAGPMPTYEWGQPQAGAPLPPQAPTQALPPHGGAAPLPPAAPTGYDASQGGAYGAPYAGSYDGDATQYIAPVAQQQPHQQQPQPYQQQPQQHAAALLPPEAPAADATQYLGRAVRQPMPGALPDAVPGGPDSEATQYIPPVPAQPSPPQNASYDMRPGEPGERQPPAEFDALFRTEPESEAGSTQQMPRFDPRAQQAQQHAPHMPGGPGGRGPQTPPQQQAYEPEPPRRKSRTGSKVPLIAAVGVGLLVVGIGAGTLLSGGDDDPKTDATKTVSDSSPAASDQSSPAADPAKEQAVALDKLLADSGNSREAVVGAVANIGACKELGPASQALRDAATQRNNLVTRLNALTMDQLPDNVALKDALTKAWKASASADTHYAAWGDQAAGKKGCHKGHAKVTPQRHAGDSSSQTASTEKTKASGLWNTIASKYELTQRSAVQL